VTFDDRNNHCLVFVDILFCLHLLQNRKEIKILVLPTFGFRWLTVVICSKYKIKVGEQVWSGDADQKSCPPTDLVMEDPEWLHGDRVKTVLLDAHGLVIFSSDLHCYVLICIVDGCFIYIRLLCFAVMVLTVTLHFTIKLQLPLCQQCGICRSKIN